MDDGTNRSDIAGDTDTGPGAPGATTDAVTPRAHQKACPTRAHRAISCPAELPECPGFLTTTRWHHRPMINFKVCWILKLRRWPRPGQSSMIAWCAGKSSSPGCLGCDEVQSGTSSRNGTRSGALGLSARLEGRDGEKEQRPPRSAGLPQEVCSPGRRRQPRRSTVRALESPVPLARRPADW